MDVLDIFFKKYSYKFPKGYPDISDPKDKRLLFELIGNLTGDKTINEAQSDYDQRIRKTLGLKEGEKIPTCKTPLTLGTDFNLEGEDEENWSKLYPILPLKKGSDIPTAGAGKG
jgi:hypothetical protein